MSAFSLAEGPLARPTLAAPESALRSAHERLAAGIRAFGSVAVAYSGGVDSSLVARVARDVLGDRALACTVDSAFLPEEEFTSARALAAEIGIEHVVLTGEITDDSRVMENPADRCYFCKFGEYGAIRRLAESRGFAVVADGTQADDASDPDRPGMRALSPLGVRSPLLEAGLTKAAVRGIARLLGLRTHDKPSAACLASRFPSGERITLRGLAKVERAEAYLRGRGFRQVRVRIHPGKNADLARIEVPQDEAGRFLADALRDEVAAELRRAGFLYVSLDLLGYRSGSSNEALR